MTVSEKFLTQDGCWCQVLQSAALPCLSSNFPCLYLISQCSSIQRQMNIILALIAQIAWFVLHWRSRHQCTIEVHQSKDLVTGSHMYRCYGWGSNAIIGTWPSEHWCHFTPQYWQFRWDGHTQPHADMNHAMPASVEAEDEIVDASSLTKVIALCGYAWVSKFCQVVLLAWQRIGITLHHQRTPKLGQHVCRLANRACRLLHTTVEIPLLICHYPWIQT